MSGESTTPDPERIAQLAVLAQALLDEIEGLATDSGAQLVALSKRSRANRRLILMTMGGFALDVVLTIALSVGLVQLSGNSARLDALTQRLDVAQTTQRQKALCPLYQLLLDSRSAAGRAAAPDKTAYDHSFAVIRDGYEALDCAAYISDAG